MGYAYDTLNRLTAVTENGVTQASYTYDTNGNRSGMTLANGVTTAYTYNAANWITGLTNSQNGTTLSSFDYTYYPSGNQASKTDHNGVVTTYEYDGLGRLTRESEQGGLTVSYAFDAAGNRASMAVTGTENYTVSYNYDANNRLISSLYTGSTTQSSYYTYDACGNLLTAAEWRPQAGVASSANYGYNGFNQLATQTVNDVSSTFAYNASGIRTAKLTENTLTGYLLDGGNVVAELEDDALLASYLRGANLISRTTNTTEYYTFNAHGDVVNLTNASGISVKTYDYDAFGNEKDRVGSDPNPFRYCGEYFDVESGAYYLRARYYDPSVGRFTQEDPEKDGLNWYTYCNNNPVLFIDPTGCQYVCADDFGGSSKPEPEPAKKDTAAERKRAHDEEKARALYEENMKEMEESYAEKTGSTTNAIVDYEYQYNEVTNYKENPLVSIPLTLEVTESTEYKIEHVDNGDKDALIILYSEIEVGVNGGNVTTGVSVTTPKGPYISTYVDGQDGVTFQVGVSKDDVDTYISINRKLTSAKYSYGVSKREENLVRTDEYALTTHIEGPLIIAFMVLTGQYIPDVPLSGPSPIPSPIF